MRCQGFQPSRLGSGPPVQWYIQPLNCILFPCILFTTFPCILAPAHQYLLISTFIPVQPFLKYPVSQVMHLTNGTMQINFFKDHTKVCI